MPTWPLQAMAALWLLLCAALFMRASFERYARLVWRSKFVLLALGLTHVLGGTFELAAWLHALCYLLALLAALQVFVLALPREHLLGGLVTLLRPLRALGVDTQPCCVRLLLTLDYATQLRGRPWRALLDEIMHSPGSADMAHERIALPQLAWRRRDTLLLLVFSTLLLGPALLFAQLGAR